MRRWIAAVAIGVMTLALSGAPQATTTAAPKPASKPSSTAAKKPASKKPASKSASKAAPKPAVKPIAPETLPHPIAMFLSQMCGGGKKRVSFKAQAVGTRFFFEDSTGVAIYGFDGVAYRKESFAKGSTIEKVLKRYGQRASGTS
jgi:hypothetical protein